MAVLKLLTAATIALAAMQHAADYRAGPSPCPAPAALPASAAAMHEYRADPADRVDATPALPAPELISIERPVGEFGPDDAAGGAPFVRLAYDLRSRRLQIAGAAAPVDLSPADCARAAAGEELPNL
ncbi:MAG: hypothetical protein Tsb0010_07820 [Parvularculaceae bacterium]